MFLQHIMQLLKLLNKAMVTIDEIKGYCTRKLVQAERTSSDTQTTELVVDEVLTPADGKPVSLVSASENASIARISTPSTKDLAKQIIRILNNLICISHPSLLTTGHF